MDYFENPTLSCIFASSKESQYDYDKNGTGSGGVSPGIQTQIQYLGIIFLHREKNEEALRALGITPVAREEIIKEIEKDDYSHSVIVETSFGDMWVFGKDYDGTELYIKISLGRPGSNTICISFHEAEHPLNYPYRK